MKHQLKGLLQPYVAALRTYLTQGALVRSQPALRLGRQAAALGLKTWHFARIHAQALAILKLSQRNNGLIKRAESFFTQAVIPIMETQTVVNRFNETMNQRLLDMDAANHQLQSRLRQSTRVEAAFKIRGVKNGELLKDSLRDQNGLRRRAHNIMSEQENERHTISHQLQDEIGQALLGIHVRLLNLKTTTKGGCANLKKEIASAQRLVMKSVRSINAFARELDNHENRKTDRALPRRRCSAQLRASAGIA